MNEMRVHIIQREKMQEKVSQAHAHHRIKVCSGKLNHTHTEKKKKNDTMTTERKHSNELAKAKRWRVSATATWYKDTLPMASHFIIYSLRPVSIVMLLVLNPLVTTMFFNFIRNYSLYANNHPNSDKYSMLLCQQRQITRTLLLETNC